MPTRRKCHGIFEVEYLKTVQVLSWFDSRNDVDRLTLSVHDVQVVTDLLSASSGQHATSESSLTLADHRPSA